MFHKYCACNLNYRNYIAITLISLAITVISIIITVISMATILKELCVFAIRLLSRLHGDPRHGTVLRELNNCYAQLHDTE